MISKITFEVYSFDDITMGINYGLDKVRFPNATPSGSFYRGRVSLIDYNDIPGGAKYKVKVIFELKGMEKPACVAEFLAIAYADPSKKSFIKKDSKSKKY
jgi:acyl dehydratase